MDTFETGLAVLGILGSFLAAACMAWFVRPPEPSEHEPRQTGM